MRRFYFNAHVPLASLHSEFEFGLIEGIRQTFVERVRSSAVCAQVQQIESQLTARGDFESCERLALHSVDRVTGLTWPMMR